MQPNRRILIVDGDQCQGHARCYTLAPELFVIDEVDGHSQVKDPSGIPPELEELAQRAVNSCPERAIRWATD